MLQPRAWTAISAVASPDSALLPLGALRVVFVVVGSLAVVLAAIGVTLLNRPWTAGGRLNGVGEALSYIGFQTLAILLAIVSFPMYFAGLATHYVEFVAVAAGIVLACSFSTILSRC